MDCRTTLAEGRFLGLYSENGWEFAARPHVKGVVVDFKIMASLWLAEERNLI